MCVTQARCTTRESAAWSQYRTRTEIDVVGEHTLADDSWTALNKKAALLHASYAPDNFVITLPKVSVPEQPSTSLHPLERLELRHGIFLPDGPTKVLSVGPHKAESLTSAQRDENRRAVHGAWQLSYAHILSSLRTGFYQGWDLHPGQPSVR